MRFRRPVAIVLLAAFFCGFGVPWLSDTHQFNDDPHWVVKLGTDANAGARLGAQREGDESHCAVCHLLRTMRSASRPLQAVAVRDVRQVLPPHVTDPRTRAAVTRPDGARAPPSAL